jgi:kexin
MYIDSRRNFRSGTQCRRSLCPRCPSSVSSLVIHSNILPNILPMISPELTWRDIQYLCIETAKMINPTDPDWERTAVGRLYSYKYGFGVLDAYKFVTAAQKWDLVKPQSWFETEAVQLDGGKMNEAKKYSGGIPIGRDGVSSTIMITKEMLENNNFEKLEHINVQVWIDHTRRGDVEVEVVSPRGIRSVLGKVRPGDEAKTGYPGWVFMSIKHWSVLSCLKPSNVLTVF